MRRKNKQIKKALKTVFVFNLIFLWIFSGWPQILENLEFPPKIKEARADAETGRPQSHISKIKTTFPENAYDSSGNSTQSTTQYGSVVPSEATFYNWSATGETYTELFLKVEYEAEAATDDTYEIEYSTDNTSGQCDSTTWINLVGPTSAAASDHTVLSATLSASQNLTQICVQLNIVKEGGTDKKNVFIEDIRTEGIYTPSANTLPVASSTSIDSDAASITLTENTTTNVVCEAAVEDADGYADITSVEARLYETAQGAAGTADDNHRYILTGAPAVYCSGSGTSGTCSFTFAAQFFANPAGWTCQVTPTDTVGAGTADTDTITMNTTLALNISGDIDYGILGLGNNSESSPKTITVTNTGNAAMDPQVSSGAAMGCDMGTIPIANQEYSAATFTYGTGTDLSVTATTLDLNLPKPTSITVVEDDSFWGIAIPGTGVGGNCTGSNTFTAIAGS